MSAVRIDLSNGFADAIERAGGSVVSINEGGRAGVSGTIWRDGLVVTAEHTIRERQEVTLQLPNGSHTTASVVGRDSTTDVALLRVKDAVGASADFADAAQLRIGQFVLAVGRRASQGLVASHGILSAVGAAWRTWRGGRIDHWFRLDLLPFTGFSGGPLIDAQGRVIGINTSGPRRSVVTVPAATVNRIVDQLLVKGRIGRGFLGVALQPVRLPKTAERDSSRGLLVMTVEPGGPSEKAGLMIGDIIVALEDKPLIEMADLQATLDPEQIGKTIRFQILRGGKAHHLSLIVGERSE
jgi:S1-C subfamily serine protease